MFFILYTAGMCEFPLGMNKESINHSNGQSYTSRRIWLTPSPQILTQNSHTAGEHHIKTLNLSSQNCFLDQRFTSKRTNILNSFFPFSGVPIFGSNIIFTSLPNENGLIRR